MGFTQLVVLLLVSAWLVFDVAGGRLLDLVAVARPRALVIAWAVLGFLLGLLALWKGWPWGHSEIVVR